MWKEDYQSEEYRKAEWRMGISLRGCSDVTVEGLSIEKTGGDGVYIGATQEQPFCRDVTIRDVECVDNHRQGISVISAENLLIENCLFAKTDGTAPQAGIDLEPNGPDERLVN
jgi:polygalacturonase